MKYSILILSLLAGCTHYYKVDPAKINEKEYAMDCSGLRTEASSITDRDLPRGCVYNKRQIIKSEPLQVNKELVK